MGALLRAHDWSASPLGTPETWPQSLRSVVGLMLASAFPMFVAWGDDLALIYNDAYAKILGAKHPRAIGARFGDVWSEIWSDLAPLCEGALAGEATCHENLSLIMNRAGFDEQTWFTCSYSPVRNESGEIAGLFCACTETTAAVLAEQRAEAERKRQRLMLQQMPGFVALLVGPEHCYEYVNDAFLEISGPRDIIGRTVREAFPELEGQGFFELLDSVYESGEPFAARAMPVRLGQDGGDERFIDFLYEPVRDDAGAVTGIFVGGYDVTDAHLAREMLRESEARLRIVQEAGGIGSFDYDMQKDEAICSPEYYRLFGLPEGHAINRESWLAILHPEDRQEALDVLDRSVAERRPFNYEYRIVRADTGETRWLSGRARIVFDAEDRPWRYVGGNIDITDRKFAEAALSESETRHRDLVDNIPTLCWWADASGYIFWYNRRWYEYTGSTPANMEGWGWQSVHDPAVLTAVTERWQASIATGEPFEMTFPLKGADGAYRPFLTRAVPLRDEAGAIVRWFGSNTDIAAQHDAEVAMRESEERLKRVSAEQEAILSQIAEGVIVTDAQGRITFVNDAAGRIHGVARLDVAPDAYSETYRLFTEDGEPYPFDKLPLARVVAGSEPLTDERWRIHTPDGRNVVAVGSARAVFGADGARIGSVLTLRDDTARHSAEAALSELNHTLENRIADAIAEREQAEEALRQSQKMEAVGQLTGGIAHDFNNLLTIITGNLDAARRHLGDGAEPRVQRALGNALTGADRAATLTQRLLAFSRRQPLAPKPIDPNKLVADMSELLHRALGETVAVETVLAAGLWRVEIDPNQLENAILNLAVNARDAMAAGDSRTAGKLTIETANAHLDRSYVADKVEVSPGQYVVLSVSDTGVGMDADTISRAFEPFFTTKDVGKGTGLGLSMVYGFVKQSGGHLKIYSEPGQGTTVKLYLPRLIGGIVEEVAEPAMTAPESSGDETILVCEDDDDVRVFTVETLRDLGYRVLEAHDGPAALRLLQRKEARIDLLFTDVVLPSGMTGDVLAAKARRLRPGLRILFTTGYARNAIVHHGRLDAGVELITKPFAYADLAARVRDMLDAAPPS